MSKKFKAVVYIAGPLGADDDGRVHRVREAISAGERVAKLGFLPFVPHLFHFVDALHPAPYEVWMDRCFAWLGLCDAVLRIEGESPGADREVAKAVEYGMTVYRSVDELVRQYR